MQCPRNDILNFFSPFVADISSDRGGVRVWRVNDVWRARRPQHPATWPRFPATSRAARTSRSPLGNQHPYYAAMTGCLISIELDSHGLA